MRDTEEAEGEAVEDGEADRDTEDAEGEAVEDRNAVEE